MLDKGKERRALTQATSLAVDGQVSSREEFGRFLAGLIKLVIDNSKHGHPLRRVLDCLRAAESSFDGRTFPTLAIVEPLVSSFGLTGRVIAVYLEGLPAYQKIQADDTLMGADRYLHPGLSRVRTLLKTREPESAMLHQSAEWRMGVALAYEDTIQRLLFAPSFCEQIGIKGSELNAHVAKFYRACGNNRGVIDQPGVVGIFDRIFRDSAKAISECNEHWLKVAMHFSGMYRFVEERTLDNVGKAAQEHLESGTAHRISFACKMLESGIIPVDLSTGKLLLHLVRHRKFEIAQLATKVLTVCKFPPTTGDSVKESLLVMIEARLENLRSQPVHPLTARLIARLDSIGRGLRSNATPDLDDHWDSDYTGAP